MRTHDPPRWLVRGAQVVAAAAAVTLVVGVLLARGGSIDFHDPVRDGRPVAVPAWARPCYTNVIREERDMLRLCARVKGRVVWVRKDRPGEYHFAVLSRMHLFIVKDTQPATRLSTITAIGPLVRARNDLREIEAITVRGG